MSECNWAMFHVYIYPYSDDSEKTILGLVLMFACTVPTSCLMTFIYNMSVEPEKRETLYRIWDPVPDDSWYWTSCVFEGFSMAIPLLNISATLGMNLLHCKQAAGEMRIMGSMLQADKVDVKACAILHQKILK